MNERLAFVPLRLARTLADLEGTAEVGERHVAEALHFRAYEVRRASCV